MKKQNPTRQLVQDLRLAGDGEYKEENTEIKGPINAHTVRSAYKGRIQAMKDADLDPEEELERITNEITRQRKLLKTLEMRRQQLLTQLQAANE
jgi:hypothetical protein